MKFGKMFERKFTEALDYGTSGYRTDSAIIEDMVDRAYLVCAIRSSESRRPVGLVLTASHNHERDNGIKYVDWDGSMFNEEWEEISNRTVNATSEEIAKMVKSRKIERSCVFVGRDTRESGERMVEKCRKASEALGSGNVLVDLGVTTTPQVFFLLREICSREAEKKDHLEALNGQEEKAAKEILGVYFRRIKAYVYVVKRVFGDAARRRMVLDSSNGVGRHWFEKIRSSIAPVCDVFLLKNSKNLNEECGSDYIKTKMTPPAGVEIAGGKPRITTERGVLEESTMICAFDGDADRVLYFCPEKKQVLDGDRLCLLFSSFLNHLIACAEENFSVTSVVTAYSNGGAMKEMKTRGEVRIAGTGVKNMQKEAEKHPISVWFENNGHGTVSFSAETAAKLGEKINQGRRGALLDLPEEELEEEVEKILSSAQDGLGTPVCRTSPYNDRFQRVTPQEAALFLHMLSVLFNPKVGDAVVDMCVAESIFYTMFITPEALFGMYKEMPNVLRGVPGKKAALTDVFVQSMKERYSHLRLHLRASGTEDVIRIYVEGEKQGEIEAAASEIAKNISEISDIL